MKLWGHRFFQNANQKIFSFINVILGANLNKSEELATNTTTASNYIPYLQTLLHKISKNCFNEVNLVSQCLHLEVLLLSKSGSEVGGFKWMQIQGFLHMYFDAVIVFVTNFSLIFRLALAILCVILFSKRCLIFDDSFESQCKSNKKI